MQNDEDKTTNEVVAEQKPQTKIQISDMTSIFGLVGVFILFSLTTGGRFIAVSNLITIMEQSAIMIILCIGMSFVMAHGNMDFSVGGSMAICSIVIWYASQINPWLGIPAGMITGVLIASIVALIHNKLNVDTFVIGLCFMFLGRGLVSSFTQLQSMNAPKVVSNLDRPVFYIVIAIVVYIIAYILFEYTKIGKYNKAIGSNQNAALLSGISVSKYKWYAFIICGVCVGLAAFMSMVRSRGVTGTVGQSMEINATMALVLGGMSLEGGTYTKIRSAVIGALIMRIMDNGMTIWGLDPNMVNIVKAVVFLLCVFVAYRRKKE